MHNHPGWHPKQHDHTNKQYLRVYNVLIFSCLTLQLYELLIEIQNIYTTCLALFICLDRDPGMSISDSRIL